MKRISKWRKQILLAAVAALLLGWIAWGNLSIQTTTYEIFCEEFQPGGPGVTVVQISDLHNAGFGEKQSALLQKVREHSPDLIAVTGDLIDSSRAGLDAAADFIEGAVTIAPVYYVTGNHEAWDRQGYAALREKLACAGVTILEDRSQTLLINGQELCLMGVDDPAFRQQPQPGGEQTAVGKVSCGAGFTLLLSHRPELLSEYARYGIDLALTGHAHGGQFRIPLIGGVVALNQGFFPKYTAGIFQENNTRMIVSRGLGNSVIPIRINNRPELVVVRLRPAG